uniref:Uncharacterized protein n=1 Tax=Sphaerodactylus townsendi TaxID=933632 RepID=A0ACB8FGA9_9SAUR
MDLKALDEFVNLPDPHYSYKFLNRKTVPISAEAASFVHTIQMTSQKWLDESEVDKPVWTHRLLILRDLSVGKMKKDCLLVILPDQNDTIHDKENVMKSVFAIIATQTSSYNHPLGHKNIKGDDIVAYTFWEFLKNETAPADVLVQFPMVKAVVRAMDTVTDYMKKKYKADVTEFTLVGLGLGGWISWLTAAVDQRVKAIAPIAMDFLNFTEVRLNWQSSISIKQVLSKVSYHRQLQAVPSHPSSSE